MCVPRIVFPQNIVERPGWASFKTEVGRVELSCVRMKGLLVPLVELLSSGVKARGSFRGGWEVGTWVCGCIGD